MKYPTPTPSPRPPGLRDLSGEDQVTLDDVRKERDKALADARDEGHTLGQKEGYNKGYEEGRAAGLKMVPEGASGLPAWHTIVLVLSLLTLIPFLLGFFLAFALFKKAG